MRLAKSLNQHKVIKLLLPVTAQFVKTQQLLPPIRNKILGS